MYEVHEHEHQQAMTPSLLFGVHNTDAGRRFQEVQSPLYCRTLWYGMLVLSWWAWQAHDQEHVVQKCMLAGTMACRFEYADAT